MISQLKKFWLDNAIYGVATLGSGIFNWLYAVLLGHRLGPSLYGVVTTLNNVVAIVTLPASVVTLMAIRAGKPSGPQWRRWRLVYGITGLALWGSLVAFSGPLGRALKMPSIFFVVFGLSAWPMVDYAANLGYVARARRYRWLGGLTVMGSALSVIDVWLASYTRHPVLLLGAFQAVSVGMLWGLSSWIVRAILPSGPSTKRSVALSGAVGVLQTLTGLTDGVVAKAQLTQKMAGFYNGLATIGQSIPYAAASLALVMMTAMLEHPEESRRWLKYTLGVYLGLGMTIEGVFGLVPQQLVGWALGSSFHPITTWLVFYGVGMLALGMVLIFLAEAVARSWWLLWMASSVGFVVWVIWLVHSHSLPHLVHATVWSLVGMAVLTVGMRMGLGYAHDA
ncbi:lipopolysaccharide biosynthesis protein [Sulfobacillus sp. hq2]|uniref:lipopolysaccharide biosynthesis protein n=1 Tax=Sulfobacillus TaxID=28033 RepID=UPI000CD1F270|nr:hypothetical protein [Sulfobacillus sp. hq2]POB10836.1 hypothetical protein CO251_08470 [Sulfobacillus sp. hq2]